MAAEIRHVVYPRQRASGTCTVQPSRLCSCTAESWYVRLPYRPLSWFAVRRPSIRLLLCAACAPPCQSALWPWRVRKRSVQTRPHSDSRMGISRTRLGQLVLVRPLLYLFLFFAPGVPASYPHSAIGTTSEPAGCVPVAARSDPSARSSLICAHKLHVVAVFD